MIDRQQIMKEMLNKWPSGLVARAELKNFTGGLLTGRTLANIESKAKLTGNGLDDLPERINHGGKAAYVANDLARWFVNRLMAKKNTFS